MTFEPKNPALFSTMNDPQGSGAAVEVSTQAKAGADLSFRIKGTGVMKDDSATQQGDKGKAAELECRAAVLLSTTGPAAG